MEKMKKSTSDILIAGGGIAGLTLAKLLSGNGLSLHLIEPYPPKPCPETSNRSGRTVALMQSSLQILRDAGLEDFCMQHGTPMKTMRLYDNSIPGQPPVTSDFYAHELGLDYFGRNIPNDALRAQLYEDVRTCRDVTLHEGHRLEEYICDNGMPYATATLDDGTTLRTRLLVGADGRNSAVRTLAGIQAKQKQYGQSAITLIIRHSRPHQNASTEFHRPGGPFALVPLEGNRSSVVWVEPSDKADALMALPKEAFEQALQEETHDSLGTIEMETAPQSWPLGTMTARTLTAPRTALIAEAAHVLSPITAQGLNLSLRDVAALAETIIEAARIGADIGAHVTLRGYENRRRADIQTRSIGINALHRLTGTKHAPLKDIRRIALKMIDGNSLAKRCVMRHMLAPGTRSSS